MTPATLTADLTLAIMALDSGEIPAARAILGAMLDNASAPDTEPVNTASPRQNRYLRNLTGKPWANLPLDFTEAKTLISDLLATGEGDYRGQTIRTTASADRYRARKYNTASIPF